MSLAIAGLGTGCASAGTSGSSPVAKRSAATLPFRFGIADEEARTFSDPRLRQLDVYLARDVVPWNAVFVRGDLAAVTEWLDAVKQAYHITPLITFQHADGSDRAPTPARYLAAFLRFRKLFPWVNEFVPWDEATHQTQPTQHRPQLAAEYYNALVAHCPGCEITSPDILDSDSNDSSWIHSFLQKARPYPKIWALNPYTSAATGSDSLIQRFLDSVHGQVWFSEVGGVVWWRLKGRLIDHGVAYAAKVAKNIFSLARLSPRITRVYYYHWRSPGTPKSAKKATWDAGLISSTGVPRMALRVVAKELHLNIQKSIPRVF